MINLIKSFNKLYLVDKNKINENNEEIKNNFNKVFEDLQLLRIDYSILIKILEKKHIGKKQINFRLKDWGISRQRYWECHLIDQWVAANSK